MGVVQEKMYMNVDDVCEILGVSKAYAYNLMRGYNAELKKAGYIAICGGQRPLMRSSAAARRSLTATLVRRFR